MGFRHGDGDGRGYVAPKAIAQHPGVAECTSGEAGNSDYRHEVYLRDGWEYKRGRMAGGKLGFFMNVKDFQHAEPIPNQ